MKFENMVSENIEAGKAAPEINISMNMEFTECAEQAAMDAAMELASAELPAEQAEMDAAAELPASDAEAAEQQEMELGEKKLGYSSSYYEHRMADALEDGNSIAYKNAKRNWAEAKAKEETH